MKPRMEKLEGRYMLTGILNGGFDVPDPDDAGFGWQAVAATVSSGRGILAEDDLRAPSLRQEFTLPAGAEQLELTIHQLALGRSPNQPPDALEIALLDADTLLPLVAPLGGLAGADAFLNIDAEGHVNYGSDTTVPGAGAPGDIAPLQFPLTVTTDLSAVSQGTEVLLAIDLLTFGSIDAHVEIDDVRLDGRLPPSLSLVIDPATDSGRSGDEFTNFTTIHLVGRTDPGQDVTLDTDGDGFDDGTATADGEGRFRFDGLSPAIDTVYRVRAANQHGPTIAQRSVVVDTESPEGRLSAPRGNAVVLDDPGFVEVTWVDSGRSGTDVNGFDVSDVTISGVDIDRVEQLDGGKVRYWYSDDGDRLPYGPVRVVLPSGAITDRAGNASLASSGLLRHLARGCAWQNPVERVDTDANGFTTPRDALVVIYELNNPVFMDRSAQLPALPPAGSTFFLVDVNCDGRVTPLDALIVIHFLSLTFR